MRFFPSKDSWLVIILLVGCLAAFLPGIHGPFLHDDYANLQLSRVGPFNWQALWDASFRNSSGPLGRPLANASFAITRWTLGHTSFDFKLVNLILHGVCGLLVYALGKRLLSFFNLLDARGRHMAALAAMALWTLHPLQVSTTLYAVQRMTQLSAVFMFIGCWWFAARVENGHRTTGGAALTAAGFFLTLLIGLAGKETAVLLPVLAGVIALIAWSQDRLPGDRFTTLTVLICIALPLVVGLVGITWKWHQLMGSYAIRDFGLGERLLTESAALWFYLRLILLPWVPSMGLYHDDFPVYGPQDWQGWLATAAWLLALTVAWRWRKRAPMMLFALAWFLGAHLLESTFLPLELLYEHRNYVALLGPALWLGHGIAELMQRHRALRRVGWIVPTLLLGAATMTRSHQWSSSDLFAIYEHKHHPHSVRANFAEAGRRIIARDDAGAIALYREIQTQVERRTPGMVWPLMLDALLQCRLEGQTPRWDEMRSRLRKNQRLDRTMEFSSAIMSQMSAGTCRFLQMDEYQETLDVAWRVASEHADATGAELAASHLAWSWRFSGNHSLAVIWLKRAAGSQPRSVEPLFDLAFMELNAGRLDQAQAAIVELRSRSASHHLPISYRIDELAGYLQQARAKKP